MLLFFALSCLALFSFGWGVIYGGQRERDFQADMVLAELADSGKAIWWDDSEDDYEDDA
jgi:hypothetical protein